MADEVADEALMLAFVAGDAAAFESLYRRHKGPLYRYLLRQCSHNATAEELFQDVWLRVIKARSAYQVTAKFTTYLYTVAHNRVVDWYRRKHPERQLNDEDCDDDPVASIADPRPQLDEQLDQHQQVQKLLSLLETLPGVQREAFLLNQEAGMDVAEIATVMGVGMETAKSRLRYALAKLRRGLTESV